MPVEQRKTINVRWKASEVGGPQDWVRLRFKDPKHGWVTVRVVDNKPDKDGFADANVTFPQNFQGSRDCKVVGIDGTEAMHVEVK